MNECFIIRIWRRVGIDLFKVWLVYTQEKENLVLSENVDKLLNFVINEIIPALNNKLWLKIAEKYGEDFLSELKSLEDEIILYGDYDSNLEPIIAYEYLWWEILAGSFNQIPSKIEELILSDKDFREKKVFGNLLKRGLIIVEHEKYPVKLHYGIYITKTQECVNEIE